MSRPGSLMTRKTIAVVMVLLLVVLMLSPPDAAWAQAGWQRTSLDTWMDALLTPKSGALFARDSYDVYRSEDAGATWARVSLPPAPSMKKRLQFDLDTANHMTMHASGAEGVYGTTNDAATWTLVLPTDEIVASLAVSPADPSIVCVGLMDQQGLAGNRFRLLRSQDGGTSWDVLEELGRGCGTNVSRLVPDPTDANRILRMADCNPGASRDGTLAESRDQGQSWRRLYDPPSGTPIGVLVGEGEQAGHLYLVVSRRGSDGDLLVKSEDDGVTWSAMTAPWSGLALPPDANEVWIEGVSADPGRAGRVYVSFTAYARGQQGWSPRASQIVVSDDSGRSWQSLGWNDHAVTGMLAIGDVQLGIDGQNLYVTAGTGVWRLPLTGRP